jgi:hypothetical protein
MIDWLIVEGFEWDAGNERKTMKHGVSANKPTSVLQSALAGDGRSMHSTHETLGMH